MLTLRPEALVVHRGRKAHGAHVAAGNFTIIVCSIKSPV
jgi:hypothetical protein